MSRIAVLVVALSVSAAVFPQGGTAAVTDVPPLPPPLRESVVFHLQLRQNGASGTTFVASSSSSPQLPYINNANVTFSAPIVFNFLLSGTLSPPRQRLTFTLVPPSASLLTLPITVGSAVVTYNSTSGELDSLVLTADKDHSQIYLTASLTGPTLSGEATASSSSSVPAGVVLLPLPSAVNLANFLAALTRVIDSPDTPPRVVATVDHAAAAEAALGVPGLLPFSTVLLFGTPVVGAPLWSTPGAGAVGVELPLEALLFETRLGTKLVAYNSPYHVAARFGLDSAPGTTTGDIIALIDAAVPNFINAALESPGMFTPAGSMYDNARLPSRNEGLVVLERQRRRPRSKLAVARFFQKIVDAIDASPASIAVTIEHDKSADALGVERRSVENKVVIFGNPALGTPAIQAALTLGLDLPLKIGAWEEEPRSRNILRGYNDAAYLFARHGVRGGEDAGGFVETANGAQAALASAAFPLHKP